MNEYARLNENVGARARGEESVAVGARWRGDPMGMLCVECVCQIWR